MRKVSTWTDESDDEDMFEDAAGERTPDSVFDAAHSPHKGPYHLSARAKVQREHMAVLRQIQAAMHSKRTVHGHAISDSQSIFRAIDEVRACSLLLADCSALKLTENLLLAAGPVGQVGPRRVWRSNAPARARADVEAGR